MGRQAGPDNPESPLPRGFGRAGVSGPGALWKKVLDEKGGRRYPRLMTSNGAAARRQDTGEETPLPQGRVAGSNRKTPVQLDRVIHERVRLAIVSALASADSLTFNELKDLLDLTDGNLSVHARRLEDAGFITCEKSFVERAPRTLYRLTEAGRIALDEYLNHMESLIRWVREK